MFRRPLTIGAATVLAVTAATVAPLSAHAASVCVTDIDLPAKIVIDESKITVDADLNSSPKNCLKTASYELQLDGNSMGTLKFSRASTEVFTVKDDDGTGDYTMVFVSGTDVSGNAIAGQDSNAPAVAKYGTRSSITSSARSGKTVTLAASVEDWSADFHDYDPAYRTTVSFQIKSVGGWQTLAKVKTDRRGVAKATLNSKSTAKQSWRVISSEDGARWGSTSATIKR